MTRNQINYASKMLQQYMENYPDTSIFDAFTVAMLINDEVEKNENISANEIIRNVHEQMSEPFSMFDFFGLTPAKHECHCNSSNPNSCAKTESHSSSKTVCNGYVITDDEKEKVIKVMLPGVKKSDIVISYDKPELTISLKENITSPFVNSKNFPLSAVIEELCDIDNVKTNLECGVLTITIPKKELPSTSRVIEIK